MAKIFVHKDDVEQGTKNNMVTCAKMLQMKLEDYIIYAANEYSKAMLQERNLHKDDDKN